MLFCVMVSPARLVELRVEDRYDMESIAPKYASDVLLETLYDINRRTWRQWRLRGQGPRYTKVNGTRLVRYDLQDVDAWLAQYKRYANGSHPCERRAA